MILSIGEMLYLMEIFIGLENKERGQIFSFSFSRKFIRCTSAHFHITNGYVLKCLGLMKSISIDYTIKYQLDFAREYVWLNTNKCYNTKSGRLIKQIYSNGSIGYCIRRKFYSLNYLRKHLIKPIIDSCPF